MLKANRKTLIVTSIVTLLPILAGVLLWDRLPEVMATHFGIDNQADGYSSKAFGVFGLPLMLVAIEWIGAMVMASDPKKQNINPKLFTLGLWIVPAISLLGAAILYTYNLGREPDITFIMQLLLGVLLVVVGNYLPKARQSYTIGIRLPWTLADEENWNRTHRLGGYLWVAGGILMIITALTGLLSAKMLFAVTLALVLLPCLYSYWLHIKRAM